MKHLIHIQMSSLIYMPFYTTLIIGQFCEPFVELQENKQCKHQGGIGSLFHGLLTVTECEYAGGAKQSPGNDECPYQF